MNYIIQFDFYDKFVIFFRVNSWRARILLEKIMKLVDLKIENKRLIQESKRLKKKYQTLLKAHKIHKPRQNQVIIIFCIKH